MLRISPIKNVNNTLNKNLSFKAGSQTNYGLKVDAPQNNIVEGGFLTGFAGIIQKSLEILNPQVINRAKSIENGIEDTKKFNKIA